MTTQLERGAAPGVEGPAPRRVPHRTIVLTAAAILVVGALLTWLLAFSSMFGVKTVRVSGEQSLSTAQVTQAAGVRPGTPLLRLDTGAVARRIEQLPEIASAQVHTHFPSTVTITVQERVAIGFLQNGARYTLVDKTGAQFRTETTQPRDLPRFEIPSGPTATASAAAEATVAAALSRTLLAEVTSIQAFDPDAITLLLTDQRVVRWGSSDQSALKAQILPTLLTQPGTTFDLTDPQQPFTH